MLPLKTILAMKGIHLGGLNVLLKENWRRLIPANCTEKRTASVEPRSVVSWLSLEYLVSSDLLTRDNSRTGEVTFWQQRKRAVHVSLFRLEGPLCYVAKEVAPDSSTLCCKIESVIGFQVNLGRDDLLSCNCL